MATAERFPNHPVGGRAQEEGQVSETSKAAQVKAAQENTADVNGRGWTLARESQKSIAWMILGSVLFAGCSTGNPFKRHPVSRSFDSQSTVSTSIRNMSPYSRFAASQRTKKQQNQTSFSNSSFSESSLSKSEPSESPLSQGQQSKNRDIQLAGFQQNGSTENEGLISSTIEGGSGSNQFNDAESRQLPFEDSNQATSIAPNSNQAPISLDQVLNSVVDCYPEIEIAIGEIESANGKVLASWGEFDRVLAGHSISQPLGFYQTYRNGVGLTQPLYSGGEVYGTYRIGDGNFEPWFGERDTNEGGELKAGFSLPFLKDRAIDERRAKLLASGAQRDEVRSNVESRLLQFQRFASQAYWDWVASGQAVQIQRQLLEFAETRVTGIEARIEAEDLAEIAQIDNDRLIAKRKNDLIKANRLLEKASIKLSIFWRDVNCNPVIANESQLPQQFPTGSLIAESQLSADIENAFTVRPELVELQAIRQQACIDRQYAENLTLPKLDVKGFAGQDVGGETSSKGDKTPFELQLGVFYEVPLERRKGLGKIQAANGKLTQIDAKIRLTSDKIRAELQDAWSAVNAAYNQIQQSSENVRLTERSLNEFGREAFEAGEIDLIKLNIYETAVATAELELLDAQYKYFFYRAIYETAKTGQAFSQ
ncbi:MAG: TolC family protein [Mariniblastus sp.]